MRKRPMVVKAVRFCRRVAQCGRAVRQLFRDERPWAVKGKEWSRLSLAYLRNLRLSPAQRRFLTELWSQYSLHVIAVFLLVAAVFLLRELGRPSLLLQEIRGETMGTTYSVKYRTIRSAALAEMEKQNITANIEKRLNVVNDLMSTYRPNSEISRFNARQSSLPFKLSPQTNQVIALAFEVNQLSGGAFDITVGPIVNAYHFGPPENGTNLPTTETLDSLFEYVGSHLLEFDPRSSTLSKLDPRVYCDLSAIAKGYGVDQLADLFDALKIKHYLIEIGGEVFARGLNDEDRPWRVGILKPQDNATQDLSEMIHLSNRAMATSGDYRNFYFQNGKRISHTVDPRTGRTIAHELASVSVIAPTCAEADAWATALMVLGPEEGMTLATERKIPALFLIREKEGLFSKEITPPFEEFRKKTP